VTVTGLAPGRFRAAIDRLPAAGPAAVRPERLEEHAVSSEDGALRVSVPALAVHEAALLTLSPLAD
jgi:hypothetical protein